MNNRLNEYLRELETHLRFLPAADRAPEIAEIAAHLNALMDAHISDGQSETDAANAALAQFGNAHTIAKPLRHAQKRKRFATLRNTTLFGTALLGIFGTGEQIFWRGWQHIGALPAPSDQIVRSPQRYLSVGLMVLTVLLFRYGVRGIAQKAVDQTAPLRTALMYLALEFVILRFFAFFNLASALLRSSDYYVQITGVFCYIGFMLLACWLAAYFSGRHNKSLESGADAVGVSAALLPVYYLLQAASAFVPPAKYLTGLCMIAAFWTVVITLFVLLMRTAVRFGEAHRNGNLPLRAKEKAG